jgi:hypothetical protein
MSTNSTTPRWEADGVRSANELRDGMRCIRQQLPSDMDEIVNGARHLLDWKGAIRRHPWAAAGAAAVAGYLLVPKKQAAVGVDAETLAEALKSHQVRVEAGTPRTGLLSTLAAAAGSLALRAGTQWAMRRYFTPSEPVTRSPIMTPEGCEP